MEERLQQLAELRSYIDHLENETMLALQALQWDAQRVLEKPIEVKPSGNTAQDSFEAADYAEDDVFLPESCNPSTAVVLNPDEISDIINAASSRDPSFKIGPTAVACRPTPQTDDRLRATFTPDERRAIYDAVVGRAPPAPAPQDLVLPGADESATRPKTELEVMAELRDMKRRRAKYKVATKSKNYSQVLREVIRNQMELYTGIKKEKIEDVPDTKSISSTVDYPNIINNKKCDNTERGKPRKQYYKDNEYNYRSKHRESRIKCEEQEKRDYIEKRHFRREDSVASKHKEHIKSEESSKKDRHRYDDDRHRHNRESSNIHRREEDRGQTSRDKDRTRSDRDRSRNDRDGSRTERYGSRNNNGNRSDRDHSHHHRSDSYNKRKRE